MVRFKNASDKYARRTLTNWFVYSRPGGTRLSVALGICAVVIMMILPFTILSQNTIRRNTRSWRKSSGYVGPMLRQNCIQGFRPQLVGNSSIWRVVPSPTLMRVQSPNLASGKRYKRQDRNAPPGYMAKHIAKVINAILQWIVGLRGWHHVEQSGRRSKPDDTFNAQNK